MTNLICRAAATHRRLLHKCGRTLPSYDLATCHHKRNCRLSCYRPAVIFSLTGGMSEKGSENVSDILHAKKSYMLSMNVNSMLTDMTLSIALP